MAAPKDKNIAMTKAGAPRSLLDYLRDIRVIQGIAQIIVIIILVTFLSIVVTNLFANLEERNLLPNFAFLNTRGNIPIADAPEWYSAANTNGEAFFVGVMNTLRAVSVGLVGATVIGIMVGIFLLSTNWLIKTISRVYVEILRNTPLLVQLYFWYYVVFLQVLPRDPTGIPTPGIAFIPWTTPILFILIIVVWLYARRTSFPGRVTGGAFLALVVVTLVRPWLFTFMSPDLVNVAVLLLSFVMLLVLIFAPRDWRGLGTGYLAIVVGVILGGALFQLFEYFGTVADGQYLILGIYPAFYISVKGLITPEVLPTTVFAEWLAFVAVGIALAIILWVVSGHVTETTGKPVPRAALAFLSVAAFTLIGWSIVGSQAHPTNITVTQGDEVTVLTYEEALTSDIIALEDWTQIRPEPVVIALPELNRFNNPIVGGTLSPQYMALVIGLIIYTSAFIAEIVRAGIQAVPYGQIEAARALGLSTSQTLTQVILPQALRVIIPPLGNQYLNLSKNSSLAIAIAFQDTYGVGQTMMNQTGQSITGFALLLVVYLSLSLIISVVMNIVNGRFQLVTR